ncbi:Helicase-like transcription factor [Mizuhopecten yessoensis]|uniref:Helicase-like transcription factor n=1 Tax=Mizuhopecten yessoensis TaxID=6573 RepID=A0A210Q6P6_MIZYE|nr:Helicase-like transcription factor [Mizuhopecten yessoensis]
MSVHECAQNSLGRKKTKAKKKWRKRSFSNTWNRFNNYEDRSNYKWPYAGAANLGPIVIGDDMGHDDLDDEVLLGHLRGNIVGIQYYRGTVNNNEMVAIEREPHNKYDCNAIRILNVGGQQVGHIKRELAKPLTHIMDNGWARLEGIVPFGSSNMYTMPINMTLWGKPEFRQQTADKLSGQGFNPTEPSSNLDQAGGSGMGMATPRRTYLTPEEMKNELDELFENLDEGDKTSTANPAKAIVTPMYTHQKQALNWMIQRENGSKLPPFWEEKKGRYFNSVTVFTTDKRPQSVRGGILADDMGLGKTLEMIALIMTNFKDGLPLAVPVPGRVRQSKQKRTQRLDCYKLEPKPMAMRKVNLKREKMSDFIVDDSKPSTSYARKFVRNISAPGNLQRSRLPYLPDDDISDSDSSVDSVEDYDDSQQSSMVKKEDPDFVPKGCPSKENMAMMSSRPKRQSKRKVRYTVNGDSDVALQDSPSRSTPKEVAKHHVAAASSGKLTFSSGQDSATLSSPSTEYITPTGDLDNRFINSAKPDNVLSSVTGHKSAEDTVVTPRAMTETQDSKVRDVTKTAKAEQIDGLKKEIQMPSIGATQSCVSVGESILQPKEGSVVIDSDTVKDSTVHTCTAVSTGVAVLEGPDLEVTEHGDTGDQCITSESTVNSIDMGTEKPVSGQEKTTEPEISKNKKPAKSKARLAPVMLAPTTSGRPRRNAKKPARYAASSDSEVENSPMKKVRVNMGGESRSVVSRNRGKGKGKAKTKLENWATEIKDQVKNMEESVNLSKVEVKNQVKNMEESVDLSKVEVKNQGKNMEESVDLSKVETKNQVKSMEESVDLSKVEIWNKVPDMDSRHSKDLSLILKNGNLLGKEVPAKPTITITAHNSAKTTNDLQCDDLPDPSITPSRGWNSPHISDDELPDIPDDIAIRCNSPGTSTCGKLSGRTPCKGARATLIVAPLSVISNWHNQLEDHIHENAHMEIYTYYGSSRTKDPTLLSKQDVVLTTYSTLAADAKGKSTLLKVDWLRIVLDEGHAIRNPNAQQTKAICQLKAERKWILTGTPIQNSMKDLWSLVNFLQINPFTDKQWWRRTIERPLDQGEESALRRVCHLMSAIALRRTKNQKINDKPLVELPDRKVFVEHIKMSEEERNVYEAMQNEGKVIVSKYFRQGTLLHNYGEVLAILMRLRQLCCHPLLIAKAAAAVKEVLENVEAASSSGNDGLSTELREKLISALLMVLGSGSDEECAICLDMLKEPVITHCAHVYCQTCIGAVIRTDKPKCPLCRGDIDESKLLEVPPEQLQEPEDCEDDVITSENWKSSSKVDAVINALVTLREEDNTIRSLVVSQFTSLLSLLEIPLRARGFRFTRLDGTMSLKMRIRAVEEFMDPSPVAPTIMLLSLKAGGVGINLTSASRVFLMDPAWNPAAEEQCFDRCHRLGQKRDVIITKFIVDDSVEVRMMELQEKKRKLMQGVFGASKKETAEQKRQNRIKDIKSLMNF